MAKSFRFDDDPEHCLSALRSEDDRSLEALIAHFQPDIMRRLKKWGASHAEAEDIFYICIEALHWAAQMPDFQLTDCRAWLRKAAWFQWLKELRRKKRFDNGVTPEDLAVYSPETDVLINEALDNVARRSLIWEHIERLSDRCRRLLILAVREERGYDEIAREMGYSDADSARQQRFKCQKRLKELIEKDPRHRQLMFNEKVSK
ncbi:MAG: sigma-70 family RNA polymerase sigma factor [Saprospiraceae bacterium]|nr:sigma-70 family RNA polymerase sigma factor [Saprospiraceae bacterium]